MAADEGWRVGLDVLVQHLPVGVFITSPSGAAIYVSDRCAALVGAGPDAEGRWSWLEQVDADDRARVGRAWAESLGGGTFDETYRVTAAEHTDTPGRWVHVHADAVVERGETTAVIGTVEDVTDLRTMRQKWGDRQLMLDAVLSNSSDLVVVVDEHARLSFVSQASERILGHDPVHWLGRDVFELLHPDDVGRAAESFTGSLDSGPGVKTPMVVRVRHADQSWRHVEIVANNLVHVEHVRGLVITARDLSDRLRAEAVVEQARDRFEQAFDRAPIGMVLVANDGRIVRANEALAHMVGHTVRDLTGRSLFRLAHPDDLDEAVDRALAVLHRDDRDPVEVRFLRRDGRSAWARITTTVIRDDLGQPLHTIAHIEDVTDQRTVREQLERAAAHDPLTGLLNRAGFANRFTEVADRGGDTPGALLIIDLDGFKAVNDTHGHAAGDELLQLIAQRLVDCVRVTDLVGRLGGDEFAVYQPDVADAAMVVALGERVRSALAAPFRLDAGVVQVSGSVGVALLDGTVSLARALATADTASYSAKRSGGDRVELTWCTELGLDAPRR